MSPLMGLLPDTWNCGLRMRRECRERFPRHQLQRKPLISNPGMHRGTCLTHVPWCMSGSLTRGGQGKRSRHMCNPQFHISGKRPMVPPSHAPPMTCHNVLNLGRYRHDASSIGSILFWFWHIMACLQGLLLEMVISHATTTTKINKVLLPEGCS